MTGKTSTVAMSTGTTSGTPQVLLAHHFKQLKLPTVLRGYDKVDLVNQATATRS